MQRVDDQLEIARLAALADIEYERERETAAEQLGLRVAVLGRSPSTTPTRVPGLKRRSAAQSRRSRPSIGANAAPPRSCRRRSRRNSNGAS